MARKAKEKQEIVIPDHYTLIAADLSLKRPGYSKFIIDTKDTNKYVESIETMSVDNKTKTKPRGQLLTEIYNAFEAFIASVQEPVFFVREQSINNCGGKMARSGTAARTGISEVVGIMDYLAWQKNQSNWDEIYPVSIKKLLTGFGKAEKSEVADSLTAYLGKREYPNDDESDSAAVGVAWLINHNQIKQITQEDKLSEETE